MQGNMVSITYIWGMVEGRLRRGERGRGKRERGESKKGCLDRRKHAATAMVCFMTLLALLPTRRREPGSAVVFRWVSNWLSCQTYYM